MALDDDELRRALARACNRYYAECYGEYRDRAAAGRDHSHLHAAGSHRGARLRDGQPRPARLPVRRPRAAAGPRRRECAGRRAGWTASGSTARTTTTRSGGAAWSSASRRPSTRRASASARATRRTNYVANHVGNFAAGSEAIARSLFFGGAPRRFPELRFAFLEGGVAWALHALRRHPRPLREAEPRCDRSLRPGGARSRAARAPDRTRRASGVPRTAGAARRGARLPL